MWEIRKSDRGRIGTLLTVGAFVFLNCLFPSFLHAAAEAVSPASLPGLLQRGVQAFSNGNFQEAAQVLR